MPPTRPTPSQEGADMPRTLIRKNPSNFKLPEPTPLKVGLEQLLNG